MEMQGIEQLCGEPARIEKTSNGLRCYVQNDCNPPIDVDCIIMAVGREANVDSLGL